MANRKTWAVVKVYIVQSRDPSPFCPFAKSLRQQNGEDEEETQRKQEAQGNWDEEATEKPWKKPNATQDAAREGMIE